MRTCLKPTPRQGMYNKKRMLDISSRLYYLLCTVCGQACLDVCSREGRTVDEPLLHNLVQPSQSELHNTFRLSLKDGNDCERVLTGRGNSLLHLTVFNIDKVALRQSQRIMTFFCFWSISFHSSKICRLIVFSLKDTFPFLTNLSCTPDLVSGVISTVISATVIVTVPTAPACLAAWSIFTTRKLHFPQVVHRPVTSSDV